MFSRVLDNARALLSRSPSSSSVRDPQSSPPPREPSPTMVTTRAGHDTNSPQVSSVTRSGRKRFIDDSAASTPTRAAKKRRSSAENTPSIAGTESNRTSREASAATQETQDSAAEVSTPVRGRARGRPRKSTNLDLDAPPETPVAQKQTESAEQTSAEEQTTAEKPNAAGEQEHTTAEEKASEEIANAVIGNPNASAPEPADALTQPEEDESVYGTPASQGADSVYATPATQLRPNTRGSARPTPSSVTPKPRTRATRATPSKPSKLSSSQTVAEAEEDSKKEVTPKAEQAAPAPKSTHIRFGSEEPSAVPESIPEPPKKAEIPSSSVEQEDSDDEAPEAVTATSAREQARAVEEEAARAIDKQESEARRKRQERESRLREQAAASKRRKQEEEAKKPAFDVASSATIQASDPLALRKFIKPSFDRHNIPALLPEDLLAAAPEVRPPTPEPEDTGAADKEKVNKHLKFLDEKPVKDVKKGPVKVRVLEKGNKLLPPKAVNSNTKSLRDSWLQGRRVQEGKKGFGGLERKKVGGGFLRR